MYKSLDPSGPETSFTVQRKSEVIRPKKKEFNQFSALSQLQRRPEKLNSVSSYNMFNTFEKSTYYPSKPNADNNIVKNKVVVCSINESDSGDCNLSNCKIKDANLDSSNFDNKFNSNLKDKNILVKTEPLEINLQKTELTKNKTIEKIKECGNKAKSQESEEEDKDAKYRTNDYLLQNPKLKKSLNLNLRNGIKSNSEFSSLQKNKMSNNYKNFQNQYTSYFSVDQVLECANKDVDFTNNEVKASIELSNNLDEEKSVYHISELINKQKTEHEVEKENDGCLTNDNSINLNARDYENDMINQDWELSNEKRVNIEKEMFEYLDLAESFSDNGYSEPVYKNSGKRLKLKINVIEAEEKPSNRKIQSELLKNEVIFESRDYDFYSNLSYTEKIDPEYLSKQNATFKKTNTCHMLSISGKKVIVLDVVDKSDLSDISSKSSIIDFDSPHIDYHQNKFKFSTTKAKSYEEVIPKSKKFENVPSKGLKVVENNSSLNKLKQNISKFQISDSISNYGLNAIQKKSYLSIDHKSVKTYKESIEYPLTTVIDKQHEDKDKESLVNLNIVNQIEIVNKLQFVSKNNQLKDNNSRIVNILDCADNSCYWNDLVNDQTNKIYLKTHTKASS